MAKGPSMRVNGNPVVGRMNDPMIDLRASDGSLLASNDDWKSSADKTEIENSGVAPTDDRESVIAMTLSPGTYTAILRGKNDSTGIAIIEVYDRQSGNSILANISTRSVVETGDNVLIGGFITGNQTGNTRILVRALGPSLRKLFPSTALGDPILELHDSNGATLESNDNWKDSPNRTEIEATGAEPPHDLESAIIRTVAPASYTAIVRGKGGNGIGVVEIYNLR
jgi:hypothetical protein